MNYLSFLLLSSTLLLACSTGKEVKDFHPYDETWGKQAQEIKIDNIDFDFNEYRNSNYYEKGAYKFSDVFSKIEYVKLESSEEAYLGEIQKMFVTPNNEFIFFDENNRSILRFAPDGKFMNKIGACGHAKQEFVHPYTIQYDQLSNHVFVADREQSCIKEYDLDGKFVKSINIGYYVDDFGIIDDKYLAVFSGFWTPHRPDETAYPIKIHDYEGNLIAQYAPYTFQNKDYDVCSFESHLNSNGTLTCNEHWSSLVYTFEGSTPKPLYYLNFGDKQIPQSMIKNSTTPVTVDDWLRENEHIECDHFYDNPQHIIMQLSNGRSFITYIQDKKDPNHPLIKLFGDNDMYGIASSNVFELAQNDKMYVLLEPFNLQHLVELLDTNPDYMKRKCGEIKDSDVALLKDLAGNTNHIIQICTLK